MKNPNCPMHVSQKMKAVHAVAAFQAGGRGHRKDIERTYYRCPIAGCPKVVDGLHNRLTGLAFVSMRDMH